VKSDANGEVVADLPAGDYEIWATRWLSPDERAATPAIEGVTGWVTRAAKRLSASGTVLLPLAASRRRSLVISEWWTGNRIDPILRESYSFGNYIELYNNADTTIYLDGMVIGRALVVVWSYPNFPCSLYDSFVYDAAGVWTIWVEAFPGSGSTYPVAPGQYVLVATDAIDHSEIVVDGPDLRSADFEFTGAGDVDNPAVPNMIPIGPNGSSYHGLTWPSIHAMAVLAQPLDPAGLPAGVVPGDLARPMFRIPVAKVLDAISFLAHDAGVPACGRSVSPAIDRSLNADLLGLGGEQAKYPFSLHRRESGISTSGPLLLQHSRSSSVDLLVRPRSPGRP
jgi:hypothetical protein